MEENEMIEQVLKWYAAEMDSDVNFADCIEELKFDRFLKTEHEIHLLKTQMIKLDLLKSKPGTKRLKITNKGYDIAKKHGGWMRYTSEQLKLDAKTRWISKTEVWLPITVSIIAAAFTVADFFVTRRELKDFENRLIQLEHSKGKLPFDPTRPYEKVGEPPTTGEAFEQPVDTAAAGK